MGYASSPRLSGDAYADSAVPFLDPDPSRAQLAKPSKQWTVSRTLGLNAGSTRGSIYNLFSSVLGAGVLGLPHAIAAWGLLPGLVMIVPFALISLYSLRLLGWSGELTGAKSYRQLAEITLGERFPASSRLVSVAIFFNTFGSLVVYLIVLGDLIPSFVRVFLEASGADTSVPPHIVVRLLLSSTFVIVLMGLVFGLPLSLVRDLSRLRYTSFLSVGSILFLASVLCMRLFQGLADGTDDNLKKAGLALQMRPRGSVASLLGGLPTFIYAFSCHFNFFSAVEALKRRTRPAVLTVQTWAIGLSLFTYVLIVCAVLLVYGFNTDADFLTNLPTSDGAFTVAKLLYTSVLIAAYPLNCHPCRAALMEQCGSWGKTDLFRTVATIALVSLSITLAIVCPNISVALSLVGGTATASILYIFPAVFFLAVTDNQPLGIEQQLTANQIIAADLVVAGRQSSLSDDDEDYATPVGDGTVQHPFITVPLLPHLTHGGSVIRHAGGRCAGLVRIREHRIACRLLIVLGAFAWFCSGLSLVARS